ncbi:hypothetical protein [Segniliparus rugosus]|uniref:Uncharacterized protein n=1 Tax=Segniliparus rugosus (strain ATCC BAA-974 / DSM 45345 / CCUG 50838 / CIP 108380 / JCM 13579 / CDC 945) TaxID=679197 RepID=U1N562_SEGRC|nr:hypothetical protein [Segniliparus rugosus]ERG69304.1 hypothetical protein HMPREF9336_04195 [Segniliparus rugosus ATCC BAA-974]
MLTPEEQDEWDALFEEFFGNEIINKTTSLPKKDVPDLKSTYSYKDQIARGDF